MFVILQNLTSTCVLQLHSDINDYNIFNPLNKDDPMYLKSPKHYSMVKDNMHVNTV